MTPDPPALETEQTRAALRRYGRRSRLIVGVGVISLVVGFFLDPDGESKGVASEIAGWVSAVGVSASIIGVAVLLRWVRMSVMLRRRPWVHRRAWFHVEPIGGQGQPALVLAADETHPEAVCSVATFIWRWVRLPEGDGLDLLVAGDPLRWAVVSTPHTGDLVVVKRPKLGWWRRKLRTYAMPSDPDGQRPEPGAAD